MKILNAYCGAGGNRALWGDDHEVHAVEYDSEIAALYASRFPNDKVIVADAHQYILEHHQEYDLIWSSISCVTHSDIRRMATKTGGYAPKYPDMKLYEEIIFLKHFCKTKWVVENVVPYYEPLIKPVVRGRHCFWSNFIITDFKEQKSIIIRDIVSSSVVYGLSLKGYSFSRARKDQILRNQANPALGLHVLNCALADRQSRLNKEWKEK